MVNVLLVDTRIKNYNLIVNSLNSTTKVVYLNYETDTLASLLVKIRALSLTFIDRLGILQHNNSPLYYKLVQNMSTMLLTNYTQWRPFTEFLLSIKSSYQLNYVDFMACALSNDTNWRNILTIMTNDTNLKFAASIDTTGSSNLGGNWYLETGDVNLKSVYFTNAIDNYNGLLNIYFVNENFNGATTLPVGWSNTASPIYGGGATVSFNNNVTLAATSQPSNRGASFLYPSSGSNSPVYMNFDFTITSATIGNNNSFAIMVDDSSSNYSQPNIIYSIYLAGTDNRLHVWNKDAATTYYTFNGTGSTSFARNATVGSGTTTDNLNINTRTTVTYTPGSSYTVSALLNFATKRVTSLTITDKNNTANTTTLTDLPFIHNSTNVACISLFNTYLTSSGVGSAVTMNTSIDNFQTYIADSVSTFSLLYNNVIYNTGSTINLEYTPNFSLRLLSDNNDMTGITIVNNTSYLNVPATSNIADILFTVLNIGSGSTVTITQPSSSNSITVTINVTIGHVVISGNTSSRVLQGPVSFDPLLTTNLGNIVYFSDNTSVATVSGSVISTVATGYSNIYGNVSTTSNWIGNSAMISLNCTLIPTVLSNFNIANLVYGTSGASFNPPNTNSSATINYISSNLLVANISNNFITAGNVGSTVVTASQAQQGFYTSGNVTTTVYVTPAPTNLTNFVLSNVIYGETYGTIAPPTTNRTLDVTNNFSYVSSNTLVAQISGSNLIVGNAGQTQITATVTPTQNYLGNSITTTFTVNKRTPNFNFFDVADIQKNITSTISPPSVDTSGLLLTYNSLNANIVSVSGNTYTGVTDGITQITATLNGDANYNGAIISSNVICGSNVLTLSPIANLIGNILVNTADELVTYLNGHIGDLSQTVLKVQGDTANLIYINTVPRMELLNLESNRYIGELVLPQVSSTDVKNYLYDKGMNVIANNFIGNAVFNVDVAISMGYEGTLSNPQLVDISSITANTGYYIPSDNNEVVSVYYENLPTYPGSFVLTYRKLPTNPPTGQIYSGGNWINFPNGGSVMIGGNYYHLIFGSSILVPNLNNIPCLTEDTLVLCSTGYKRVDCLDYNDTIITSDGRQVKIENIQTTIAKGNKHNYPYIVTRGCLTSNYPCADLRISKNHLIKIGDMWAAPCQIPGLRQDKSKKYIKYYHIRLPNYITDHLVVNEGTIIESLGDINKPEQIVENKDRFRIKNYFHSKRYTKKTNKPSHEPQISTLEQN